MISVALSLKMVKFSGKQLQTVCAMQNQVCTVSTITLKMFGPVKPSLVLFLGGCNNVVVRGEKGNWKI